MGFPRSRESCHVVALEATWYDFVRIHRTLRHHRDGSWRHWPAVIALAIWSRSWMNGKQTKEQEKANEASRKYRKS